jgi:hypothetical protein
VRSVLTNEIVDARITGRPLHRIGDVLGYYTSILWGCDVIKCRYEWKTSPNHIINRRSGCPQCAEKAPITNESVDAKLEGRCIQRLESVKGALVSILWKCTIDEYRWKTHPNNIVNKKTGCPQCSKQAKTTNENLDRAIIGRSVLRIGEVVDAKTPIEWICLLDNYKWKASPDNIKRGRGCPQCAKNCSGFETAVYSRILEKYTDSQHNVRGLLANKRFELDIFIPSLRIAIEVDGEYWHNSSAIKEKDIRKNKECKEVGIKLFRMGVTASGGAPRGPKFEAAMIKLLADIEKFKESFAIDIS